LYPACCSMDLTSVTGFGPSRSMPAEVSKGELGLKIPMGAVMYPG
jgi:hypothetical protein